MNPPNNIPSWCDSIKEWRNYIFNAHGKAVNTPVGNTGDEVHIGIIDTVKELPENHTSAEIAHEESVLQDVNTQWTTPHGIEVFNTICTFAPNATFSFIQAAKSNDRIAVEAFYEAIERAIEIDVDILNISADDSSQLPVYSNPYAKHTKRALDEEIIVVGATGNWKPDTDRPPIGCPAAMEQVIGVGGFVTKCPCEIKHVDVDDKLQGPYYALKKDSENYAGIVTEQTFCGWTKCCDGNDCIIKSIEKEWDRNSIPTNGGPDILAPVHYPRTTSNNIPYIVAGTSYSAPIVTAALALAYEECISELDKAPNHYHAMQSLRQSAASIRVGEHKKLNITALLNEIKSVVK